LVPVKPRSSRSESSNVCSGIPANEVATPLTTTRIIYNLKSKTSSISLGSLNGSQHQATSPNKTNEVNLSPLGVDYHLAEY
jgi:hypothetical protein